VGNTRFVSVELHRWEESFMPIMMPIDDVVKMIGTEDYNRLLVHQSSPPPWSGYTPVTSNITATLHPRDGNMPTYPQLYKRSNIITL
jgi:hypothetical protein